MKNKNYSDQVFVNCPFDNRYRRLFEAIVFTILDCGFIPRCSKEIVDSSRIRLNTIVGIIEKCRYGIHDISRVEIDRETKLPRFNMPFELGIFYGAKEFGTVKQNKKNFIILEKYKYRYLEYISDLSGVDIEHHNNSVKNVIYKIRNWLLSSSGRSSIPHAEGIFARYTGFRKAIVQICKERSVDYRTMPFVEFTKNVSDWLKLNEEAHVPIFYEK